MKIWIFRYFVLSLWYIKERDMKRLNETEKDLIEAVRNFRASKGRMEKEAEYEWMIYEYLHQLMYED